MLLQRTDWLTPIEVLQGCHAPAAKDRHIAFGRGTRHASQPGRLVVGDLLADQPQDFHPLLHPRIGMLIPFLSKNLQILLRKRQSLSCGHPWPPSRKDLASYRERLEHNAAAQKMPHSGPRGVYNPIEHCWSALEQKW